MRISITLKLLLWCLTIIAIFYATTSFLFTRIRGVEALSRDIVGVNYRVTDASESMLEQVLALQGARRRHEILQKEEYLQQFGQGLEEYGKTLGALAVTLEEPGPAVARLQREYETALASVQSGEAPLLSEEVLDSWLDTLSGLRREHRTAMGRNLLELERRSAQAQNLGRLGLAIALAAALAGSLLLALHLNRSLRALRKGIAGIGSEGHYGRVHVRSRDELGEVASAFNDMSERLENEEQMRADFVSMLSHEIRTPLTSISEAVSLFRDGVLGPVNDRQTRFLDISRREVERLRTLLEKLMQVSALESRGPDLEPADLDVADLLEDLVQRVQPVAEARGVGVEARLEQDGLSVHADMDHVRQVLFNLIGNAVKFSPPGSRVMVAAEAGENGGTVFRVRDAGPGIPEEERELVFQKYYRGAATRESVDGVGLGLSIANQIVQAHGGRMWLAQDIPDGVPGSEFCFSLPGGNGKGEAT
jgi:signal transduction histidine kinase